jgi:hypothetical protein
VSLPVAGLRHRVDRAGGAWYLRFGLSYRDVAELLAERGIELDHVTAHCWMRRFTPMLADVARFGRHPGRRPLARGRDVLGTIDA